MKTSVSSNEVSPAVALSAGGVDSWRGWLAVFSGFLALMSAFSAFYSFGAFLTPMSRDLGGTKSALGGIFSTSTFLFLLLGIFTGPLSDRFGPRRLFAIGGILIGIGFVATSYLKTIDFAFATFGVCVGLGIACIFVPAFSNVSRWFVRHRGKASGIVATGVGVGTMIGTPMAVAAIGTSGWRQALLVQGSGASLLILAAALLNPAAPVPKKEGIEIDRWQIQDLIRNREYLHFYVVAISTGFTVFLPFVFLVPHALHLGISAVKSAGLVVAVGIASTLARPIVGLLGDKLGVLSAFKISVLLTMISYVIWFFSNSYFSLLVMALIIGAAYGGRVALVPAVLARFFGIQRIGTVVGLYYTGASVGALAAGPLAGFIIGPTGNYQMMALVFCGFSLLGVLALVRLRPKLSLTPSGS